MSVLILGNVFFFTMTAITLCRARIGTLHKDNASLFYSKQKLMQLNKLLVDLNYNDWSINYVFTGFVPSLFFSCWWESHGWRKWFLLQLVALPICGFLPIFSTYWRQYLCSLSSSANRMFGHFLWKSIPACRSLTASVRRAWSTITAIKRMKIDPSSIYSKQLFNCGLLIGSPTQLVLALLFFAPKVLQFLVPSTLPYRCPHTQPLQQNNLKHPSTLTIDICF